MVTNTPEWNRSNAPQALWWLVQLRQRPPRQWPPSEHVLDQATRDYVRTELGFRMVPVTDGRQAPQVERLV
jgi:hypothetical protein